MRINPYLMKLARDAVSARIKAGFIPAGDPAAMGGDPAAGGAPPMDPSMGGGMPMDPSMGGMPMDPAAGGGSAPPPGIDPASLQMMVQQAVAQAMPQAAGAAGAAGGQIKPKIDINVAVMQMSKMLARICEALNIHVPPHELIATPQDLTAMANQQAAPPAAGAIQPIGPVPGAGTPAPAGGEGGQKTADHREYGEPFDPAAFDDLQDRAESIRNLLTKRRGT